MYGPSPALAPALVTRGAARGTIGVGLLAFQVGSALASVPAFTAMQASAKVMASLPLSRRKSAGGGGGGDPAARTRLASESLFRVSVSAAADGVYSGT